MTTIIELSPTKVIEAYNNNKPKGTTNLFLIKNGVDIPIYGIHVSPGNNYIAIFDINRNEITVTQSDSIELRT